jgi:hypothetical protein
MGISTGVVSFESVAKNTVIPTPIRARILNRAFAEIPIIPNITMENIIHIVCRSSGFERVYTFSRTGPEITNNTPAMTLI